MLTYSQSIFDVFMSEYAIHKYTASKYNDFSTKIHKNTLLLL